MLVLEVFKNKTKITIKITTKNTLNHQQAFLFFEVIKTFYLEGIIYQTFCMSLLAQQTFVLNAL